MKRARVLSALCFVLALAALLEPSALLGASQPKHRTPPLAAMGRQLFVDGCSSCHGVDARGLPGQGPSLHGAGAAAADFYLSTGRMPLDDPKDQPLRTNPAYERPERDALVAY